MLNWVEHEKSFITSGSDCIFRIITRFYYVSFLYFYLCSLHYIVKCKQDAMYLLNAENSLFVYNQDMNRQTFLNRAINVNAKPSCLRPTRICVQVDYTQISNAMTV